jgi:hypothetical protein
LGTTRFSVVVVVDDIWILKYLQCTDWSFNLGLCGPSWPPGESFFTIHIDKKTTTEPTEMQVSHVKRQVKAISFPSLLG